MLAPQPPVGPSPSDKPLYEFSITVVKYNTYGDKIEARYPTIILAANTDEVTEKVRVAFSATYDDFRKFWSHNWVLMSVTEIK